MMLHFFITGVTAILYPMLGSLNITTIVILIVVILISLTIHEFMHAFVGFKLGDDTAKNEGRVSLNPLVHIDPVMTIALPIATILLFGAPILAARPVPFDPGRVKFDEFGAAMIAFAGPASNFVLAAIGAVVLNSFALSGVAYQFVGTFAVVNISLFVFNLIPIPPLDGSRVLYAFAPESVQNVMRSLEPFGLFIVFAIVLSGGTGFIVTLIQHVQSFLHIAGL